MRSYRWICRPVGLQAEASEMEEAMHRCNDAFSMGKIEVLKDCLDPAIVLYTPAGEFRGRRQVMDSSSSAF